MDESLQTTGRRYHFLNPIGKGGFGTVYRSEVRGEGGFSKAVAIKLLNADMVSSVDVAQRLRDEARVLGLVRHRAIVQVDGLIRIAGRWAMVMEYVDGVDLKAVTQGTPVPLGPSLEIIAEVAGALHTAYHTTGPENRPLQLLHRDIKPSNIQLTKAGEVKVLDFGIARADFSGREAETRSVVYGSINYMSPERLDFGDGPESDVYSLGCVLAELLLAETMTKTSAHPKRHAATISSIVQRVSAVADNRAVLPLLESMLAYESEDRPTAREVERAASKLRLQLDGSPLLIDWAERVVPALSLERESMPLDDLCGTTLSEQTQGAPVESDHTRWIPGPGSSRVSETYAVESLPDKLAPAKSTEGDTTGRVAAIALSGVALVGLMAAGLVAVLLLVVGVVVWQSDAPERNPPPEVPVDAPPSEPPPTDVVPKEPPPTDVVPKEPPPTDVAPKEPPPQEVPTTSVPTKEPPPREVPPLDVPSTEVPPIRTPSVEPPPSEPPLEVPPIRRSSDAVEGTRIGRSGDARRVFMRAVDSGRSYDLPGNVPPGTYDVYASFDGRMPTKRFTIRVAEVPFSIQCKSSFGKCQRIE